MRKPFFTSDPHFGHANVIEYAKRPFEHVDEMNEELVRRWNAVVTQDSDEVYVLGDVALCRLQTALMYLRRLRGRKYLIFGNHDKRLRKEKAFLDQFVWAKEIAEITVQDDKAEGGEQRITLCHFAMRTWNKSHYGAWQLYGHSHGSLADDPHLLSLDVGVDAWNYAPVSYEEIRAKMKMKSWQPIDHHQRRH